MSLALSSESAHSTALPLRQEEVLKREHPAVNTFKNSSSSQLSTSWYLHASRTNGDGMHKAVPMWKSGNVDRMHSSLECVRAGCLAPTVRRSCCPVMSRQVCCSSTQLLLCSLRPVMKGWPPLAAATASGPCGSRRRNGAAAFTGATLRNTRRMPRDKPRQDNAAGCARTLATKTFCAKSGQKAQERLCLGG
jgi:hypothetical protein